jgi:hypothetical protein
MVKLNNRKGAGIALETASRELVSRAAVTNFGDRSITYRSAQSMNPAAKEQSSALLEEAADLFSEAEDPVRASDMYLRAGAVSSTRDAYSCRHDEWSAGKFLEGFNNDKAAKLYDKACSLFNVRFIFMLPPCHSTNVGTNDAGRPRT